MKDASSAAIDVVLAARRWVRVRAALRRVLDSKRAGADQVAKVKADYQKANDDLERTVVALEQALGGRKLTRKQAPFPWREMLGMLAAGAKAVEDAVASGEKAVVDDAGYVQATVVEKPKK